MEAILRACFEPGARNETFTVAGPDVITYRDMGRMTRIAIGKASKDDLDPDRTRVWRRYVQQYDISKGKNKLKFYPSVPFAEGLREIVEAAQAKGELPRPGQAPRLARPGVDRPQRVLTEGQGADAADLPQETRGAAISAE